MFALLPAGRGPVSRRTPGRAPGEESPPGPADAPRPFPARCPPAGPHRITATGAAARRGRPRMPAGTRKAERFRGGKTGRAVALFAKKCPGEGSGRTFGPAGLSGRSSGRRRPAEIPGVFQKTVILPCGDGRRGARGGGRGVPLARRHERDRGPGHGADAGGPRPGGFRAGSTGTAGAGESSGTGGTGETGGISGSGGVSEADEADERRSGRGGGAGGHGPGARPQGRPGAPGVPGGRSSPSGACRAAGTGRLPRTSSKRFGGNPWGPVLFSAFPGD